MGESNRQSCICGNKCNCKPKCKPVKSNLFKMSLKGYSFSFNKSNTDDEDSVKTEVLLSDSSITTKSNEHRLPPNNDAENYVKVKNKQGEAEMNDYEKAQFTEGKTIGTVDSKSVQDLYSHYQQHVIHDKSKKNRCDLKNMGKERAPSTHSIGETPDKKHEKLSNDNNEAIRDQDGNNIKKNRSDKKKRRNKGASSTDSARDISNKNHENLSNGTIETNRDQVDNIKKNKCDLKNMGKKRAPSTSIGEISNKQHEKLSNDNNDIIRDQAGNNIKKNRSDNKNQGNKGVSSTDSTRDISNKQHEGLSNGTNETNRDQVDNNIKKNKYDQKIRGNKGASSTDSTRDTLNKKHEKLSNCNNETIRDPKLYSYYQEHLINDNMKKNRCDLKNMGKKRAPSTHSIEEISNKQHEKLSNDNNEAIRDQAGNNIKKNKSNKKNQGNKGASSTDSARDISNKKHDGLSNGTNVTNRDQADNNIKKKKNDEERAAGKTAPNTSSVQEPYIYQHKKVCNALQKIIQRSSNQSPSSKVTKDVELREGSRKHCKCHENKAPRNVLPHFEFKIDKKGKFTVKPDYKTINKSKGEGTVGDRNDETVINLDNYGVKPSSSSEKRKLNNTSSQTDYSKKKKMSVAKDDKERVKTKRKPSKDKVVVSCSSTCTLMDAKTSKPCHTETNVQCNLDEISSSISNPLSAETAVEGEIGDYYYDKCKTTTKLQKKEEDEVYTEQDYADENSGGNSIPGFSFKMTCEVDDCLDEYGKEFCLVRVQEEERFLLEGNGYQQPTLIMNEQSNFPLRIYEVSPSKLERYYDVLQ